MCRKNSIKGRARDPPMSFKDAMDMVNNVLAKNGISHLSNLCAMDPYVSRHQLQEKLKKLEEKVSLEFTILCIMYKKVLWG